MKHWKLLTIVALFGLMIIFFSRETPSIAGKTLPQQTTPYLATETSSPEHKVSTDVVKIAPEKPKEDPEHLAFIENERRYAIEELKNKSLMICAFEDIDLQKINPQANIEDVCKNQNSFPVESLIACLTTAEVCLNPKTPTEHDFLSYLNKSGYMKYLMDTDELAAYVQDPENPITKESDYWMDVQSRIDLIYSQIHY